MKILRRTSHNQAENADQFLPSDGYHLMELAKLYPDAGVRSVYLKESCRTAMLAFIQQSLEASPVPEVGGFLLGKYSKDEWGTYQTAVEVFVPAIEVAFNSPILLDFGTEAMIAWNQAQEAHPELTTVGWFHTHPGHTPYLSQTDINMHEGFFYLSSSIGHRRGSHDGTLGYRDLLSVPNRKDVYLSF